MRWFCPSCNRTYHLADLPPWISGDIVWIEDFSDHVASYRCCCGGEIIPCMELAK